MKNFTKNELFEIEKGFDMLASQVVESLARRIDALSKIKGLGDEFCAKQISEYTKTYDVYRTISAKCQYERELDTKRNKEEK